LPARKGVPNGKCRVCQHPERVRLELQLAGGASLRSVARKYSIDYYALRRHWQGHVSDEHRAALTFGPVQRQALSAQVAEESASVLDHYRAIRAGLYTFFTAALEAGDRMTGAHVGGKLKEVNDSIAKLTGQLASSPLVQVNQTNVFLNDPGFATFKFDLINALADFPDARAAVLAEFDRLAAATEFPALEHQVDADEITA
jgi:hypothetical protein